MDTGLVDVSVEETPQQNYGRKSYPRGEVNPVPESFANKTPSSMTCVWVILAASKVLRRS